MTAAELVPFFLQFAPYLLAFLAGHAQILPAIMARLKAPAVQTPALPLPLSPATPPAMGRFAQRRPVIAFILSEAAQIGMAAAQAAGQSLSGPASQDAQSQYLAQLLAELQAAGTPMPQLPMLPPPLTAPVSPTLPAPAHP